MTHMQLRTKEKRRAAVLRRLWMGAVVLMMTAATILQGGAHPVSGEVVVPQRQGKLVMYVYDEAGLTMADSRAKLVDQVNYSFALIRDGQAVGDHWLGIRQMSAWLKKHPEVQGVISVGGWGADGFSQACATEEGRIKLANSMVSLMEQHGFTGLDIDWEYPGSSTAGIASSPEDEENWYQLLSLLRKAMDEKTAATGKKHLLSVAVGAGQTQLKQVDGQRMNQLVDQLVLMSYDLTDFSKITQHHAGLYPDGGYDNSAAKAVETLLQKGVDSDRILLGVPAYGRVWRQVSGGGDGLNQRAATSGNKTLTYAEMSDLTSQGYTRYFDEKAQAAWYFDGSTFVSGEDEETLGLKMNYLLEKKLQGAAVWCWNHDPQDALATALHEALLAK